MKITIVSPDLYTYGSMVIGGILVDTGFDVTLTKNTDVSADTDVPGLYRMAALDEIEVQGWSLNLGRYVGVAERGEDDFVFAERLEELDEELEILNVETRELEARIAEDVAKLLEGGRG